MEREIEIKAMECVFCGYSEHLKVKDEIVDRETGAFAGRGMDAWTCPCCGETIELGLDCFMEEQNEFRQFTDCDNWSGLLLFCQSKEFDDLMLIFLAKNYLQKKDFRKAEKIAEVLLKMDSSDWEAKNLTERIRRKEHKLRINATFDEIEGAFHFSDFNNHNFLDLETGKIRLTQDTCQDKELEKELDKTPARFIEIPQQDPSESYRLMESFIHEIGEHQGLANIADELKNAIGQKKPFARFKDVLLNYPKVREQWFAFEGEITRERLCDWLCEHNLICRIDKGHEGRQE